MNASWSGSVTLPPANKWPCRAAVIRAAERGRRSWKPFSCNHGERVPVRPDPIRHAAEIYGVTGRDAQIAGQSRFTNPTTTWLEARSVLRNRKLKFKPLGAWDFWGLLDLEPQCKRKSRNPYTTKLNPTSIGLRLSSQRYGSQGGSHPCTRPRVAAKTHDRVLQQRLSLIHI